MPYLPSVVVMSGAGKKQKRWSRLEKKVKRFLIISMSNVPSAVVISGAAKGKYEG